ncbi:uncharacterized protein TNCV_1911691 [Trichonephila clavipes]|nr:uncharacterized protein TNCV_1911691 [Trichonephila clavipes]
MKSVDGTWQRRGHLSLNGCVSVISIDTGRRKLTDSFIDKLQNYYGIAIKSNVNNIEKMQSAVIAAFFHCCSNKNQSMHGQCPVGPDSWCKFQRATFHGKMHTDTGKELP